MLFHKVLFWVLCCLCFTLITLISFSSNKLNFFLVADDMNLLYADKNLRSLEVTVNKELASVYNWLMTNKLSSQHKEIKFCNPSKPEIK